MGDDLLSLIDNIDHEVYCSECNVITSLIQTYKKCVTIMEQSDGYYSNAIIMESASNKENPIIKIFRIIKQLIRKFIKTIRRFMRNSISKKLSKLVEKYRRMRNHLPAIDPSTIHLKQNVKLRDLNFEIEVDLEKDVIYSHVMLNEGHTKGDDQSIENYIDIMNHCLDRWLWMVEDENQLVERIEKYFQNKNERIPVPGILHDRTHRLHKAGINTSANYDYALYDFFDTGFTNIWHNTDKCTQINISEFSKRFNEITQEYSEVVKRADVFCDKLERVMRSSSFQNDIIIESWPDDEDTQGYRNFSYQKTLHRAEKIKKISKDDEHKLFMIDEISSTFALYMSALVDGYMILKEEARILANALETLTSNKSS